jgi:toxin YoeB
LKRTGQLETLFDRDFLTDLQFWVETDRRIALRVLELVEATRRDPFQGIGKPEPLKHALAGCWARRINQEHRIVYCVTEIRIDFLQARYHY